MEVAVALLALLSLATIGLALLSRRAAGRAEDHVADLRRQDLLTGLPVRAALVDELSRRLGTARPDQPVTVAIIELARFAAVNETYGHEAGDTLLAAVAGRLDGALRPGEAIGRLSGPQLVVVSGGPRTLDEARARATALLEAVAAPVRIGQDTIRVRARVGVAQADRAGDAADDVLAEAAIALRAADEDSTQPVAVFGPDMHRDLPPLLAEDKLQAAFDAEQFWVFYLPVVELGTNRLVGTEALLRWADPDHGVTEPARFLEALESTGLIVPVGRWAIRTACAQAMEWKRHHPASDLTMTVNVSPRQLLHPTFCADLASILADTGMPAADLCLEIAAGSAVYDSEGVRLAVRQAKTMGVQLALDDFGIGLASLDYMRRFQVDVLKIERSFVQRLAASREDRAIVEQLIGLGQALEITTVAEGVDNADEAAALLSMNCDLAQGYWWMRPQPADALDAVIQRGRILPGAATKASVDWTASG